MFAVRRIAPEEDVTLMDFCCVTQKISLRNVSQGKQETNNMIAVHNHIFAPALCFIVRNICWFLLTRAAHQQW